MFLHDACNQPVSLAWIGNICSRVAVGTWGWHHCSPVSLPSSGQCSCCRNPPPRSPFTAGCVMTVIPAPHHNAIFCGRLLLHQSSVTLNWMERKAIQPHRSLCQSSVALFFLLMAVWLDPFTPPTIPKTAAEISSRPALPELGQSSVGGCLFLY